MIKAVIFDLDGTLLDTLDDLADAANAMLAARGHPPHPVSAYRRFVGDGMATLVQRAHPPGTHLDEQELGTALRSYQEAYARRWDHKTRPYPGIEGLLGALVEQGIGIAVVSNKGHAYTRPCIDHFFPDLPWGAVYGQRDGIPRKPHPAGALDAACDLGVAPEACAFVGDSGVDMQTGTAAGMVTVGVLWGFREAEELQAGGARHLIAQPAELLDLISR